MTITPEQRDAAFQAMLQEWNNHVRRLNFHWCPANEKAFILQNALDALIATGWQPVGEGSVAVPKTREVICSRCGIREQTGETIEPTF